MKDLSVIITSFNTSELLRNCLDSIKKTISGSTDYEIIVIDNASSDNTREMLDVYQKKNTKTEVIVIENKSNIGFSKANNQGIKISRGKYLLFLNADTVVYENSIEGVINFIENNKEVGAATCKIILPNGEMDDACHRGFPTPWNSFSYFSGFSKLFPKTKVFSGYNMSYADFSKPHEIDSCCGAFMVMRRSAGEEIGWWDEDYFWYGEDLDFCFSLKEKGWKIYFLPQFKILHYKGASGGIKDISKHLSVADEKTKKLAQKARFEAMRIFYRKHYGDKYPRFISFLTHLGISVKEKFSS